MVKIIDPRTHVFHFFINASSFFFLKVHLGVKNLRDHEASCVCRIKKEG